MPIRLVVADNHPLILDGLESLFRLEENFQLLAMCTDGIETLEAVRRHRPDVAILGISLWFARQRRQPLEFGLRPLD